jgi:hypothetical protein
MTSYVTIDLRRFVVSRANELCEYYLIHDKDCVLGCQVDHVIAEKHGGKMVPENLAYACALCNRAKGSDTASIAAASGLLTPLFNPRMHRWAEHFELQGVLIQPRTDIGEVAARLLAFNLPRRIAERELLASNGAYPPPEAVVMHS